MKNNGIIFFDGVCIFCSSFIRFVIKRDAKKFRLCFLQSEIAGRLGKKFGFEINQQNPESLILLKDGRVFEKSSAAIEILRELGGFWKITALLLLIPKASRDFFYDFFGRNRYKWFGKKQSCESDVREIKERLKN